MPRKAAEKTPAEREMPPVAPARTEPQDLLRQIRIIGLDAHESGDLRTALKACELEGKLCGMFKDKTGALPEEGLEISWRD
jgi:hypothetical protein